jgi:hypothetical protein
MTLSNQTFHSARHVIEDIVLRRERVLPITGRILVRVGQRVNPDDQVAEAQLEPEFIQINVIRGLGLLTSELEQYLQVEAGSRVYSGDLLAGPVGLMRRVVRSPQSGEVIAILDGQLILEPEAVPVSLKAGYPGEVIDLVGNRGIILETRGDLIQGEWGNGAISHGQCLLLAKAPQQTLTTGQLGKNCEGKIVCAGHCEDAAVIRRAAGLSLAGLVLFSLNPLLVSQVLDLPFPVMVLEGFGKHALNVFAFRLLQKNNHKTGCLNAQARGAFPGSRPELLLVTDNPASARKVPEHRKIESGQVVRVVTSPYLGKIGVVEQADIYARLPNGLNTDIAEVRMENGEILMMPLANLEVFVHGQKQYIKDDLNNTNP